MAKGKGHSRRADVPAELVARLSRGEVAARTLSESLVVRHSVLLGVVCPAAPKKRRDQVDELVGILPKMRAGAELILEYGGPPLLAELTGSPSDTVLGYVAMAWGMDGDKAGAAAGMKLERRLAAVRPLAEHPHFGVREWAWLGLRPRVDAELDKAIHLLEPWTQEPSAGLRRFASEITRPRGVWCKRLVPLVKDPEQGRLLLEPLRADPEKYVQLSVGNWLNDASKDNPAWVRRVAADWRKRASDAASRKATEAIVRRGMRTLNRA